MVRIKLQYLDKDKTLIRLENFLENLFWIFQKNKLYKKMKKVEDAGSLQQPRQATREKQDENQ